VAEALTWVSRIVAVAAVMVAPGLAGIWLDERVGTGFFGLAGFALGVASGIWYLLIMTRSKKPPNNHKPPRDQRR
jgi:hypothetical protein